MQVVDLEADQCGAGEGELEVVVGVLQEGEVALAIGVEGVVEEVAQEEAVSVLEGVEVEVVIPILQGLAQEVVDHSMQVWRCDDGIFCIGANTQGLNNYFVTRSGISCYDRCLLYYELNVLP